MPKGIELSAEDAAAVLDVIGALYGPAEPEEIAKAIRTARYLRPVLEQAFADAGVDPDAVGRPEIPLMKPRWAT